MAVGSLEAPVVIQLVIEHRREGVAGVVHVAGARGRVEGAGEVGLGAIVVEQRDMADNDYGQVDNIFTWDGRQYSRRSYTEVGGTVTTLQQTGVYAALRLKPIDPLTIILGTRVSWWNQENADRDYAAGTKTIDKTRKTGVVTPYAGVIYDLNDTYAVYAS